MNHFKPFKANPFRKQLRCLILLSTILTGQSYGSGLYSDSDDLEAGPSNLLGKRQAHSQRASEISSPEERKREVERHYQASASTRSNIISCFEKRGQKALEGYASRVQTPAHDDFKEKQKISKEKQALFSTIKDTYKGEYCPDSQTTPVAILPTKEVAHYCSELLQDLLVDKSDPLISLMHNSYDDGYSRIVIDDAGEERATRIKLAELREAGRNKRLNDRLASEEFARRRDYNHKVDNPWSFCFFCCMRR